jgi:hypothetical protein
MKISRLLYACALAGAIGCVCAGLPADAAGDAAPGMALRDGSHDFDFDFGVWKTHITRVTEPFAGDTHSITLDGTVTVRKVWGGKAALEEIEADGPNGHWEGATLFLYNPTAHQWSENYVNSKVGMLTGPPLIGAFKDGRAELYSQDVLDGRTILVRATWSDITTDAHHYEEDYSDDGGQSWKLAFSAHLTRASS